jgi:hypothetical protein
VIDVPQIDQTIAIMRQEGLLTAPIEASKVVWAPATKR